MNYGCQNLKVVISGGTSGIGLATAGRLLAEGAKVFLLGRSEMRGRQAVQLLQETTDRGTVHFISCDVTSKSACEQALLELEHLAGSKIIDILINSAGVYEEESLESLTEAAYTRIFDTNVKGTLLLIQAALPYMRQGGSIVNISSDAGISGNYGCPVYCASKGAVVALTKALALDLAPAIRVNCVCPADVDTPLLEQQLYANGGSYTKEDMAECYPLGRIGKAEEIAHVICSVASPVNSYMTGSIIAVDGGLTAK